MNEPTVWGVRSVTTFCLNLLALVQYDGPAVTSHSMLNNITQLSILIQVRDLGSPV